MQGIQDSRGHQVHRDFQVVQVSPEVKVNKDSPDFQVNLVQLDNPGFLDSRVNQVKEDHKERLVAQAKLAFPVKMDNLASLEYPDKMVFLGTMDNVANLELLDNAVSPVPQVHQVKMDR